MSKYILEINLIFGTDKEGIKQRIGYELDLYTFLVEHEALVDSKIEELSERSPEWFEWKNENGTYAEGLKERFRASFLSFSISSSDEVYSSFSISFKPFKIPFFSY